ncbi:MAG: ABC transporter permease [Porphyromonas sp.]|nr:ABC transporter permease [Porphyromonas sp.]
MKQLIRNIKQSRVLYGILIASFSISIAFSMVVYMIYFFRTGDIGMENNRSRMLFSETGTTYKKDPRSDINTGISLDLAKVLYDNLPGVEMVAYNSWTLSETTEQAENCISRGHISGVAGNETIATVKLVDPIFFRMYEFTFLSGQPFDAERNKEEANDAVISDKLAKRLFGSENAVGKYIRLNMGKEIKVSGVVEQVSAFFSNTHAEVYLPAVHRRLSPERSAEGARGRCMAVLLLEKGASVKQVKDIVADRLAKHNASLSEYAVEVELKDIKEKVLSFGGSGTARLIVVLLLGILVLVPALTMSGMVSTLVERRRGEIGVRKTYGATVVKIVKMLVWENLLMTMLAGVIGVILSFVLVYLSKNWLLAGKAGTMTSDSLQILVSAILSPSVLLVLFGVCLLLSLLSVIYPAYRHAKAEIIQSIK